MIHQYQITFDCQSKEPPNLFWGYNLYGALTQNLPAEAAEVLHAAGPSPLSQYVTVDKATGRIVWHLTVFGEWHRAFESALSQMKACRLEGHEALLTMAAFEKVAEIGERAFAETYLYQKPCVRRLRLQTCTPVSFKSGGEYVMLPTTALIFQSAAKKWNAFAREVLVEDDETIAQLAQSTKITAYRLNSFYYQIKGVKIPSYYGEMTLFVRGSEPLVRLAGMLLHYLEFSGLGIKCALGMGGIKTAGCTEQPAEKQEG